MMIYGWSKSVGAQDYSADFNGDVLGFGVAYLRETPDE